MATYIYQLKDGTEGELSPLFLEKSKVIKEMLESVNDSSNVIPLVNEDLTKERLEKICDMLSYLNMDDKIKRKEKKRLEEVMAEATKKEEANTKELAHILNIVDFYDITDEDDAKSLWTYLVNFFAETIRTAKTVDDLKKIFGNVQLDDLQE